MAGQLIESMTTKWRPSDYKDDFRTKLRRIIDAEVARQTGKKGKAKAVEEEAPAEATTNVVDFMALLKRSLEKKGSGGAARKAPRKATAKRSRTARRKVS
jgi:DNA end-binding protein Ku